MSEMFPDLQENWFKGSHANVSQQQREGCGAEGSMQKKYLTGSHGDFGRDAKAPRTLEF